MRHLACLLPILLGAPAALAAEGVIEINQSCATGAGCLPGDSAGFPVTLGLSGGSFVLTGNLVVSDANTTAIEVSATDVALDLNGFSITGPTVCTGYPPRDSECSPVGTGKGIHSDYFGTAVTNGAVRGMGSDGLDVRRGRVDGVAVFGNGGVGIRAEDGSIVIHCTVHQNRWGGIISSHGVVRENVLRANGDYGITSTRDLLISNTITKSLDEGIFASSATAYGNNQLDNNNGGSANPQVVGTALEIAPNMCGGDLVCP